MLEKLESLIVWAEANPVLAAALIGIVWPMVTGALSFAYDRLEERFPNAVSFMRHAGLDLSSVIAMAKKNWPKRLPPLPVFLLVFPGCAAMKQVDEALEKTSALVSMVDPLLRTAYELQRQICMGHEEPEQTACLTAVESQFDPVRDQLADVRMFWCAIKPEDCDSDSDGMPDAKDSCPTIPGTAAASGCKDGAP